MKFFLRRFAEDFLWMMYPSLCAACGRPLFTGEECICTPCRFHMPRTGFHLISDNPVVRHFWGKVRVEEATAYYFFNKGERVQRMIHQLKYKGRKDVGHFAGRLMGHEFLNSPFESVDVIVPVPLHKSRMRSRGYNQSDCIALGIAEGMKKTLSLNAIERLEATSTQTRKHRFDRYKNVDRIFRVSDSAVAGKNILLVDDVITTGSTLISCAEALLDVRGTKVFIAAIACA